MRQQAAIQYKKEDDNYHISDTTKILGGVIEESLNHIKFLVGRKQALKFKVNEENYVYFLVTGEVNIHRKTDDKIISTFESPFVLGLSTLHHDINLHYIKTTKDSVILQAKAKDFFSKIDELNLWKYISYSLSTSLQKHYLNEELAASPNIYGVVKKHIEHLWKLPEEQRKNVSLYDYILSRSVMSRSSLNKVLKELSVGGYITINRGKLKDVKKMPERF